MKKRIVLCVLTALASSSLAGQGWTTQLGIQGGILRQKPAGTRRQDAIDRWELPSSGSIQPSFFLVARLNNTIGLESSLGARHTKFREASGFVPGSSDADIRLTLRADIAVSRGAYVAAGAMIRRRDIDGGHSTQTGLVGAVGLQHEIGPNLNARIEAQWVTQGKTDSIAPSNVYGLLFGVSRQLSRRAGRASSPTATFRPWRTQVGAAGGFVQNHLYGTVAGVYVDARETVVDFPGSEATATPPLFVDVPLRGRLAFEAGLTAQRTQQQGATLFDGQLAPRLNVAICRGLYAAAGGNVRYIAQSGAKGIAFAGVNVAAGYRVGVVERLEGRVDLSYTAFKPRADFPLAQNTVAVLLGLAIVL